MDRDRQTQRSSTLNPQQKDTINWTEQTDSRCLGELRSAAVWGEAEVGKELQHNGNTVIN